jgi:hypothetical protein
MQKTLYQKKHNNMKKLVIIMLVLLTMTQNSTAQTAGGETKIFPMFGLTLSKMNNDIILTDAGNGQGDELKPKYKFGITAGATDLKTTTLASAQVCSTQCTAQNIQTIPI